MNRRHGLTMALVLAMSLAPAAHAQSLAEQWRNGLSGARLTAYAGSVTSSNSTLTVINFCTNGRYSYSREGSWSVPGAAGGASNNRITGQWSVRQNGYQVFLDYLTDSGARGSFMLSLQNNGRVNIGGTAYSVQPNGAGC